MKAYHKLLIGLTAFLTMLAVSFPELGLAGGQTDSLNQPPIVRKKLENGLTVIIKPNAANEVIATKLFIKMGFAYEPTAQRGISIMLQKVVTRGTSTRSGREIDLETELTGSSLTAGLNGDDYGYVALSATTAGFEKSFAVFLDVIQNPVFPQEELEKEKSMTLQRLASFGDNPGTLAYVRYKKLFYGEHPYGASPEEYAKTIAGLTREDLKEWYRGIYQPENMVLSIVGNVDVNKIMGLLQNTLGKLPAGQSPVKPIDGFVPRGKDEQIFVPKDTQAAFLILGYPAPDLKSKDAPAMEILNWILGGSGMGSRLFGELREKQGLAYSVSSDYNKLNGPSQLYVFMATSPENIKAVTAGIVAQFNKLTKEPITEKELTAAKIALKGSYLMSHETNSSQGHYLGAYELLGLGYEYDRLYPDAIDKVTVADLQRVAEQYFKYYTLSIVGPEK